MRKNSNSRAFTLIELLVVSSIMTVVMLAVYSSFASGMKLWRNSQQLGRSTLRVVTGLEKIGTALRQAVDFSPIGFNGSATEVSFPSVESDEIVKVSLVYDLDTNSLKCEEEYFRDIQAGKNIFKSRVLVPQADDARFSYFYFDGPAQQYRWSPDWQSAQGIPLAIKVLIKSKDEEKSAIVVIPVS